MRSNELKELKKTLLKRVVKVPKSHWNDGKCEASEELDQNAHGIIIAVRKTKKKYQPIVVDVKFSPCDGHEESACEMSVDHVMKMLQPVARYSVNKIKEEELDVSEKETFLEKNFVTQDESKRTYPSNEMEVESSSSSSNDSVPLSNMQKNQNNSKNKRNYSRRKSNNACIKRNGSRKFIRRLCTFIKHARKKKKFQKEKLYKVLDPKSHVILMNQITLVMLVI